MTRERCSSMIILDEKIRIDIDGLTLDVPCQRSLFDKDAQAIFFSHCCDSDPFEARAVSVSLTSASLKAKLPRLGGSGERPLCPKTLRIPIIPKPSRSFYPLVRRSVRQVEDEHTNKRNRQRSSSCCRAFEGAVGPLLCELSSLVMGEKKLT
jgi:hypothetical protein